MLFSLRDNFVEIGKEKSFLVYKDVFSFKILITLNFCKQSLSKIGSW